MPSSCSSECKPDSDRWRRLESSRSALEAVRCRVADLVRRARVTVQRATGGVPSVRDRQGDHGGRFRLPDGRSAVGTLTLAANRPPTLSLVPDTTATIPEGGKGFPQRTEIPRLVGHLFSNEEVVLGDAHVTEWIHDRFQVSARWAVIGLSVAEVDDDRWTHLDVRVTGLESVLGNAIAAMQWPKSPEARPLRYSVDLDPDSRFVSEQEGVTVDVGYETRSSLGDPYRFTVTNFAIARLTSAVPLAIDEWLTEWISPLRELLSLATGVREEIVSVTLLAPVDGADIEDQNATIRGTLFGSGITQEEAPAERPTRRDGSRLIPAFILHDAPPLAPMIRAWTSELSEATAAPALFRLAIDPELPMSVRVLLCAQAIEALDASQRADREAMQDVEHRASRERALTVIGTLDDGVLAPEVQAFVRKSLARTPLRSLAGRIKRSMAHIPDRDSQIATWDIATALLKTELEAAGRLADPLHERLASTRNVLSHGEYLSARALQPGREVLEGLLRGLFLVRLGFDEGSLAKAYGRMAGDG